MRPRQLRSKFRALALTAVAALAVGSGGCLAVAAGAAAAGGVAGYAYYKGSIPRDYAASFEQTWTAARAALADLGMPVAGGEHNDRSGTLDSRADDGTRVEVALESVGPPRGDAAAAPQTRVSVRVGVFGDHPLSDQLLAQIQVRLATPGAPCPGGPVAVPAETAPPPLLEVPRK